MDTTVFHSCPHINKLSCYCSYCDLLLCKECSRSTHSIHNLIYFANHKKDIDDSEVNTINELLKYYEIKPIELIIYDKIIKKAAEESNVDNEIEGWACVKCTAINDIYAKKCAMCYNYHLTDEDLYENKLKHCATKIVEDFKKLNEEGIGSMELICDEFIKSKSNNSITDWFSNDFIKSRDAKSVFSIMERQIHLNSKINWRHDYEKSLEKQNARLESYFKDDPKIHSLLTSKEPVPLFKINECIKIGTEIKNHVCKESDLLALLQSHDLDDHKRRTLLVELNIKDYDKLELLINTFNDPSLGPQICDSLENKTMNWHDIRTAIIENFELESIENYLMNDCLFCCLSFPASKMKQMLVCDHQLCVECFIKSFTELIEVKHPNMWTCPCCNINDSKSIDLQLFYNNINDIFQELIDLYKDNRELDVADKLEKTLSLFNQKLNEQRLMMNDDFHWCPYDNCAFGFLSETEGKLQCTQCRQNLCGSCGRKWLNEHENVTCQEFEMIMLLKDPDLNNALNDIGIECPNCHMRYALAPGGCLHFDCTRCQKMFCGGCSNFFFEKCEIRMCEMPGFHAHHPRNCIYYLRDESPELLEKMLQNKDYKKLNNEPNQNCKMSIVNKEMKDKLCNAPVHKKTGLCDVHYKEYLITLINRYQIDPIEFFDNHQLNLTLFQAKLHQLKPLNKETNEQFRLRLIQEIKAKCPFYIPKASQKQDPVKIVDPNN